MEDKSRPPHKFTDLCLKLMCLKLLHKDESSKFLFDAIIRFVSGHQQRCAIATYRTNDKEAAALVKKI
jgi:hypothetical protein